MERLATEIEFEGRAECRRERWSQEREVTSLHFVEFVYCTVCILHAAINRAFHTSTSARARRRRPVARAVDTSEHSASVSVSAAILSAPYRPPVLVVMEFTKLLYWSLLVILNMCSDLMSYNMFSNAPTAPVYQWERRRRVLNDCTIEERKCLYSTSIDSYLRTHFAHSTV